MKYINKILVLIIICFTSEIYSQSKWIGNQSFTLGQNFDEKKSNARSTELTLK